MERKEKIKHTLEKIFSSSIFQQEIKNDDYDKELWSRAIDYAVIMEEYDESLFEEYMRVEIRRKDEISNFWMKTMAQKLDMDVVTQEKRNL